MARTTLQLEEDAMKVAKAHAERYRLTLGQAVSHLVRRAAERPLVTDERPALTNFVKTCREGGAPRHQHPDGAALAHERTP